MPIMIPVPHFFYDFDSGVYSRAAEEHH